MASWTRRTLVLAPPNGTASHTVAFAAAAAGSLLVCVAEGSVTSTTPSGWTLPANGSAVNNTGMYVWHKTAVAGESSFTTTHNADNYPVGFVVYEFAAGSTFVKSVASSNEGMSGPNPALTALTGTNSTFGAVGTAFPATAGDASVAWSGTPAPIEDVDVVALAVSTDGYIFSVAVADGNTSTSFTPTGTISGGGYVPAKEALTFAVKVMAGNPPTIVLVPAATGTGVAVAPYASGGGATAVMATRMLASSLAEAPAILAGQTVSGGPTPNGAATLRVPAITALQVATIAATAAPAAAVALLPTVTAGGAVTVTAKTATGSGSVGLPTVTAQQAATVGVPTAGWAATIPTPGITAGATATIQATAMQANSTTPAPTINGGIAATVLTITALGIALMLAPEAGNGTRITIPTATGTGRTLISVITGARQAAVIAATAHGIGALIKSRVGEPAAVKIVVTATLGTGTWGAYLE